MASCTAIAPNQMLAKEISALHNDAVNLTKSPTEALPAAIKDIGQKISKMVADQNYAPYKRDLQILEKTLASLNKQITQKADISLDCLGVAVRVRSIFRKLYPDLLDHQTKAQKKKEKTISDLLDAGDLKKLEESIVKMGFDLNATSTYGSFVSSFVKKACDEADLNKALAILGVLVRAGGELSVDNDEEYVVPALHRACLEASTHKEAIVRFLLSNGADPNLDKGKYLTSLPKIAPLPLMLGRIWKRLSHGIVQELFNAGMNPNMQGVNGTTPLRQAFLLGHKDLAQRIVYNGANIDAVTDAPNSELAIQWNKERKLSQSQYHQMKAAMFLTAYQLTDKKSGQKKNTKSIIDKFQSKSIDLFASVMSYNELTPQDNSNIVNMCYQKKT